MYRFCLDRRSHFAAPVLHASVHVCQRASINTPPSLSRAVHAVPLFPEGQEALADSGSLIFLLGERGQFCDGGWEG